jgi:hypothetical protein
MTVSAIDVGEIAGLKLSAESGAGLELEHNLNRTV